MNKERQKATAVFNVVCTATYKAELEIPIELVNTDDNEKIAEFIRDNLDEVPVGELEWLSDLEESAITADDIIHIVIE